MARLQWDSLGSHMFEAGVDRGVFYPNVGPGLPWNGLVNVKEDPDGSVLSKIFVDGVPFRTQKTKEGFAAVLQAYTSPREFDDYDGTGTQQRLRPFGLSYRTMIGNDISAEYGYKIHIVYNAIAMPSHVDNSTTAQGSLNATPFSWGISTTARPIPGAKPAAHLIIDSSIARPGAIQAVEDVLYGSVDGDSRLPEPEELMDLFDQNSIFVVIDHGDGTWTAIGPDDMVRQFGYVIEMISSSAFYLDDDSFQVSSY